ncbi:dihydrolipoamide dehydrogenase [Chloroherpeton thalassium ATCC 35110]|uniref:Dihydrolipoyl dehydrogenase n=1 Tax=Chloroherpeton thalassium (strain ATCC 35110 / GB-78) TaxID=517418 RepID=B3QVX7_CHLT3|nr:dihydrolipoyl dehydrogenase [Chloroherpeton thalassium]ACF14631.1 dihydrolipoamide dehydrogenase [Chloroherpeton thalassium ATCC 35110]
MSKESANKTPHEFDFDIAVIGSGPGGYECAIRASQLGYKTCIIEKEQTLGGVCLNWGCIPTKSLLKNAEVIHTLKDAEEFGIKLNGFEIDFTKVIRRSRKVATKMAKGVEFLMKKNKIEVKKGYGKLKSAHEIEISYEKDGSSEVVSSQHIILATGTKARSIPSVPVDRERIITSYEAMVLKEKPESLTVIGAGAIGMEFAYFYNAVGTKVTVVELMPQILPNEDEEIATTLAKELKKQGIEILTDAQVQKAEAVENGVKTTVKLKDGSEKELQSDYALVAIGLTGNVENLGLEEVGVETERGFIKVDEFGRTNVEGVYAIGDVAGGILLAHKASVEGINCVEKIAGLSPEPLDPMSIPACTYCQPSVAHLGMTEKQALEKGYEIKVGKFPFMASGKATASGHNEGMVKLIFDKKYGELLGAHIIGYEATEMIAELGMAKKLEATSEWIHKTVHAHPTFSEAVKEAAAAADGEAINI